MKLNLPRTAVALLLATTMCASAQLSVSIDLDPATPGIQSVRTLAPGTIFTAEIVLTVGASGLSSYGISIFFDNVELNLNGSPASVEFLPAGFSFNFTPGVAEESNTTMGMPGTGHVYTFEAATFGTGPTSTTFSIGSVSFKVTSALNDGLTDITPGFFNTGVDGAFDNAGNSLIPTFVSASVVPEPSTFALTAVALTGFAYANWSKKSRRLRKRSAMR